MPHNPYLHVAASYYMLVEALNADPQQLPLVKSRVPEGRFLRRRVYPQAAAKWKRCRRLSTALPGITSIARSCCSTPTPATCSPSAAGRRKSSSSWAGESSPSIPDVTLALTGAPDEAEAARKIAQQISPNVITLAGETTLRELFVLYTMADVLVTNDSGPGHFSSMTDITSIVLFGPETPQVFGPLGPHSNVVRTDLSCSPCVNAFNHRFSPCKNNVCMQQIERR